MNPVLLRKTNINRFTYDGMVTPAVVASIYDGDTMDVVFSRRGEHIRLVARMNGYDCPEKAPRKALTEDEKKEYSLPTLTKEEQDLAITIKCGLEKEAGRFVTEYIKKLIVERVVRLECGKFDKYGRVLSDIYVRAPFCGQDIHINQHLIDRGYGKPYDGGKKTPFTLDDFRKIIGDFGGKIPVDVVNAEARLNELRTE